MFSRSKDERDVIHANYRKKKRRSLSTADNLRSFVNKRRSNTDADAFDAGKKNAKNLIRKLNKKRTKTIEARNTTLKTLDDMESPRTQIKTRKYVNDAINDTTNGGLTFEYGFRYYYWDYYKDNEDRDRTWNNGNKYKYWYIQSKENNLKLEMMNLFEYNPILVIKNKEKKSIFGSSKARSPRKSAQKLINRFSNSNNSKEKENKMPFNDNDSDDHNDESKSDEKQADIKHDQPGLVQFFLCFVVVLNIGLCLFAVI